MNTQISLQLSEPLLKKARQYAKKFGYATTQDLVRELLRRELYEPVSGRLTAEASEDALRKNWDKEEKAWAHLQKET